MDKNNKSTTFEKERYDALDGLRALACIGIVLMHVKANLALTLTDGFLYSNVINFAADFVSLFMMVSAFGLCCGYYSRFREGTINLNSFYSKRYQRVLPFFSLLTLIDVLLCILTEHFSFTDTLVGEIWEALTNMTLAFGLIPGNDISVVGVGWFLGVIFMFYMLFPFFVFLMHTKKRAWFTTVVSIFLYTAVYLYFAPVKGVGFSNASFIHCVPFFMVGGLIYLSREGLKKNMEKLPVRITTLIITIAYTCWFFIWPEQRFMLSNLVLYGLWLILAISETTYKRKQTLLNNPVMAFISGVSMEVYLCHMMFFRFIEKLHLENFIDNTNLNYWITCILVLCGAICFAVIWKRIEKELILK